MTLVKTVRQTAPAHILGQNLLFLRGGKAVFCLQLFQKPDGSDIVCKFLTGSSHAQSIVVDVVIVPLFRRDIRVQDGGRDFSGPARCQWGCGCFLPLLWLGLFRGGRGLGLRLDGLLQISQGFSHWPGGLPLSQQMLVQGIFGQLGVKLIPGHNILKQRAVRFAQGHVLVAIGHQHILF